MRSKFKLGDLVRYRSPTLIATVLNVVDGDLLVRPENEGANNRRWRVSRTEHVPGYTDGKKTEWRAACSCVLRTPIDGNLCVEPFDCTVDEPHKAALHAQYNAWLAERDPKPERPGEV